MPLRNRLAQSGNSAQCKIPLIKLFCYVGQRLACSRLIVKDAIIKSILKREVFFYSTVLNVFVFEETFSSTLCSMLCYLSIQENVQTNVKEKTSFALRANVLFQWPLYVHYILLINSLFFKVCVSHRHHKYSIAPDVFCSTCNTLQECFLLISMIMLLTRSDENQRLH